MKIKFFKKLAVLEKIKRPKPQKALIKQKILQNAVHEGGKMTTCSVNLKTNLNLRLKKKHIYIFERL